MRKEHIDFSSTMPLNISYASVKEYPIHWHNCIEIIYVLKGSINISIDTDNFDIYQNELEIINVDETHQIHSNEENNLLIFHIDPQFFKKYYSDIKNIFFYTNTSDEGARQEEAKYNEFRIFLAKLLCEVVQKQENYKDEIQKILIDLLFHLINNFHYLLYENTDLKDNNEQLERYHRISKYIFNNYNNNITLQAIAKKEFLSPHYLSHEIKNATGSSFTDLINLTRVEESVKLLLETDQSISDISDEVGFSHTRYLNKHFKHYYDYTPLQFRRKNKMTEETYEKIKTIISYQLKDSVPLLYIILEDYERFNYENKIRSINVDMESVINPLEQSYKETLSLGDAFDLLIEDNKDNLESLQDEIHFNYGRIENFFSNDMGIFKDIDFFNWNRAKSVLEYLNYIHINPLIVLDNLTFSLSDYKNCLKSFISYFSELEYIDLTEIKFQLSSELNETLKASLKSFINEELILTLVLKEFNQNKVLNTLYDTAFMLPHIIHKELFTDEDMSFLKAFDAIEKIPKLNNEVFIGYPGLVNDMNIRKPSYYAYYLLSKLSGFIVAMDKGYIITKDKDSYSILLYTYNDLVDNLLTSDYLNQKRGLSNFTEQKISLNLTSVNHDSRIIFYEINDKLGSSYNYWQSMGAPKRLNLEELEILKRASFPKIEFKFSKKSPILNIRTNLKGYGATLILIIPLKE